MQIIKKFMLINCGLLKDQDLYCLLHLLQRKHHEVQQLVLRWISDLYALPIYQK